MVVTSINMETSTILPCKSKTTPLFFNSIQETPTQISFKIKKLPPLNPESDNIYSELHLKHLSRNGKLNEAVIGLGSIIKRGHRVKPKTYVSLLSSCIYTKSIEQGRMIHRLIGDQFKHNKNTIVETKLVSMYAMCGSLEDARRVFDEMSDRRDFYTWSAMIGAYARERKWSEVVELFFLMIEEGNSFPDDFMLAKILQAAANLGDIDTGKLLHSLVVRSGLSLDSSCIHVNNVLLSMYAKCGDLSAARKSFEKMDRKNRVTWNSIISGYCLSGKNEEAWSLFDRMQQTKGVEPDLITWNILIASHNQSGNCDLALQLMKKMKDSHGITPNVFTWTSVISGHAQNNREHQALELFREMLMDGVEPNGVTIASALSACTSLKALNKGKELHSVGIKIGTMGDVLVGNSVIDMYGKCGKLEAAQNIFNMISKKDSFTWNSMIGGYTQAGYFGKAYDLFMEMKDSGVQPNVVTWNVMVSGFIQRGDDDQAMVLFSKIETDGTIERSTASWNLLISGLLQNGQRDQAFRIFRQMQYSNVPPNSITVSSILSACSNLLAAKKVKEIHCRALRLRLESDIFVANSLINSYAKSGEMASARSLFETILSRDAISWNTLISGYILHGCPDIALDLFDRMRLDGFKPNRGTLASVILAYSLAGMVEQGKNTFSNMTQDYQISPSSEHYLAMIDLLGRAGRLEEALEFIEERNMEQESTVWNVFLTACRVHGNVRLAVLAAEYLFQMEPRNFLLDRLLLQLYSLAGVSEGALSRERPKRENVLETSHGCSRTEVNGKVHTFMTGDYYNHLRDQLDIIQEEIKTIALPPNYYSELEGRQGLCIEEEEKEATSGVHSEKLAISFAFIASHTSHKGIRIIKNHRMCSECHKFAKLISLRYGREIFLYDSKCYHHFKYGRCSCRDYW